MRVTEFLPLNEYTDLEREKANIIQTISGQNATDHSDKVILDRIWRILHSEDMNTTLTSAFNTPLSDEDMPDKTKEQHRVALTRIIGNLDSDYNALSNFINKLEKGGNNGVINTKALNKRVSSFADVFKGDAVAINAFTELKNYGTGKTQKGPGEYALAMLSDKIRLASGKGDTYIKGIGNVEIKTETTKGGGRLGAGGSTQEQQMSVIENYAEYIPTLYNSLKQSAGGSVGIKVFVKFLNVDLPVAGRQESQDENGNIIKGISGSDAKKMRKLIAQDLLKPTFGAYADPIVKQFGQEDPTVIEYEYGKQNFNWYKAREGFDAFLIINYPKQKFVRVADGDDLIKLREEKHLVGFSISIVGTHSGAMREQFAQMAMGSAKV